MPFFLKKDPCPHVPRCSHERTLSALRRQKQRFKTEEELKKQEVCVFWVVEKQNKTTKITEVLPAVSKGIRGGTMRAKYEIKTKAII